MEKTKQQLEKYLKYLQCSKEGIMTSIMISIITALLYMLENGVAGAFVPLTRKVNGKSLEQDIDINKTDVGLGNVANIAPSDLPVSDPTKDYIQELLGDIEIGDKPFVNTIADGVITVRSAEIQKTLLRKDSVINHGTLPVGSTGFILIEQDNVGYHLVTLSGTDTGDTAVDFTPGVITKLSYTVDDEGVYWTSEVLNPILPILPPSTITDLTLDIVNTTSIKIHWTAPRGNADDPDTAADLYYIVASESPIDSLTDISGLRKVAQTLTPKKPGEREDFVITKLKSGRKYWVTVVSRKSLKGRTRQSSNSNIISFYTYFDNKEVTTTPSIIPLNSDALGVTEYRTVAMFTNPTEPYDQEHERISAKVLADQTNIINLNGIPGGHPTSRPGLLLYQFGDPYRKGWYNFDYPFIHFDLQDVWDIDSVYLHINTEEFIEEGYTTDNQNIDIVVRVSPNGTDWIQIGTVTATFTNDNIEWLQVDIDPAQAKGMRYLEIGMLSFLLNAVAFYGVRQTVPQIKGVKFRKETPKRNIKERTGINGFFAEQDEDMMSEVASITRFYNEAQWVMGPEYKDQVTQEQYPNRDYTLEKVKYAYDTSFMWSFDDELKRFQDAGIDALYTVNNSMPYLRYAEPKSFDFTPVDPLLNMKDLSVTTNPQSYKHYCRYVYNLISRYGKTVHDQNDPYIQLQAGEPFKSGLDLVKWFEPGNETDRYWAGEKGFNNPEEHAAFMSAVYDGHKGALGAGFGVKPADPNMKMLNPGLYIADVGRIWRMIKWWDKNRGVGDYPLDILNIHFYSVWNRDAQTAIYSDQPAWGIYTEAKGSLDHEVVPAIELRNQLLPNREFWVTEFGYDEQNGGTNAPPFETHAERARYKSFWLIRGLIQMYNRGVDVVTIYWWANTTIRVQDIDPPESKLRDTFLTSGITDGIIAFNDWNRKWLTAGYYLRSFIHELGAYDVEHEMVFRGENKLVTNNVFGSYYPELTAYALIGKDNTANKGIILWVVDAKATYKTIKVYVESGKSLVNITKLEDAEVRKTLDAEHITSTTQTDEGGTYVLVQVGECPVFIQTENIGVPKLKNPENIQLSAVSTTAIKLAWLDKNTITNNTTVFISQNPNSDFTVLHNGFIDNGEYVASNLTENTTYYFRIQFQNGSSVSDLSEVIGGKTLVTMPQVSGFRVLSSTTSTLKLSWDLTLQQQSAISGFQVYKSLTIDGDYVKVADLPATAREYTDTGLATGTDYFYKIRTTDNGIYFSGFSLVLSATTQLPSEDSPVPLAASISYTGDAISIKFDQEVKDAAGSEAAFTIIRGGNELINVTAASVKTDRTVIVLVPEKRIYAGEAITVGYDFNLGNLKSIGNIPVNTFTNQTPVNHTGDQSLFVRRAGLNMLNNTYSGQGEASNLNWIDLYFIPEAIVQSQGNMINVLNGTSTGNRFLFPANSYQTRWSDSGFQTVGSLQPTTPEELKVRDIFPDPVRQVGSILYKGNDVRYLTISNLNPDHLYNVYVFVSAAGTEENATVTVSTFDSQFHNTWKFSNGLFNYGVLSELKPGVNTLPGSSSMAVEYNPTTKTFTQPETTINKGTNDITIKLVNNANMPAIICGIVFEEILPVSL